jgi:hypothetical protein
MVIDFAAFRLKEMQHLDDRRLVPEPSNLATYLDAHHWCRIGIKVASLNNPGLIAISISGHSFFLEPVLSDRGKGAGLMDQPQVEHSTPTPEKPLVLRGMGVVSFSLGFFSLIVFWWFPFGLCLASAGLIFGTIAFLSKVKVGDGDNLAFVGPIVCATSISIIVTYRFGVDFLLNR